MKIVELNHLSIHVKDLESSKHFYKYIIGLTSMFRPDLGFPGAWFKIGNCQELHLIAGRDGLVNSSSRGNHFALSINSMEEAEKMLIEKNQPYKGPKLRADGASQIFLQDPDGYFVELLYLPPS